MKHSPTFQVDLDNIPLINLRIEFNTYYALLKLDRFRAQFVGEIKPIETPYITWYGMSEGFFTMVLQKAILGVEAYLPGAVFVEMSIAGLLNSDNVKYIENPWLLGGRSVTENYYHRLPSMLRTAISLKLCSNRLWEKNIKFYTEIRNPLFHGHQLSHIDLDAFSGIYEHLATLYDWIDSWHTPENLIKGGNALLHKRQEGSST